MAVINKLEKIRETFNPTVTLIPSTVGWLKIPKCKSLSYAITVILLLVRAALIRY
jgi:hypothetical protein